jgi:hypothetical protein
VRREQEQRRHSTGTMFWTGLPVVAALLGWALAALMLPNAQPRQDVPA